MSVCTKIGIQLNVKLGGEAWAVEIPVSDYCLFYFLLEWCFQIYLLFILWAQDFYLNNRVSVKELSADSCPSEIWCSENKYLPEKQNVKCKQSSFKNATFPRSNSQTDSLET